MSRLTRGTGLAGLAGLACLAAAGTGCSFIARDTPTYARDTSALLDTREAEVAACYDAELARNRHMIVGTLTLTFTVQKQTGKVTALTWDRSHSTVSEALATCVSGALMGLTLPEADRRDGQATFKYSFRGSPGSDPS